MCGLEHLSNCHGEWYFLIAGLGAVRLFWSTFKEKALLLYFWIKANL